MFGSHTCRDSLVPTAHIAKSEQGIRIPYSDAETAASPCASTHPSAREKKKSPHVNVTLKIEITRDQDPLRRNQYSGVFFQDRLISWNQEVFYGQWGRCLVKCATR